MATLADELLNDFEDSGSEQGDDANQPDLEDSPRNGLHANKDEDIPGMEIDNDEEEMEELDEEGEQNTAGTDTVEDEDDAKAKVERMKLGGVSDVRSIAGLMQTLKPVLQVRSSHPPQYQDLAIYHGGKAVLTYSSGFHRKLPITRVSLLRSERSELDPSKMTPNMSS
jgi:U4/U6 small nuclear ribonucleoprotein PRP31